MPPVYAKPENALKRAEELLALNTPLSHQQAFDHLVEVFQSKRFKFTPINVLEPIVLKFLDLCVATQRKSYARQALNQYKFAVQNNSTSSIEKALNHLISAAEAKLTEATETARQEIEALPENPLIDDDLPLQPTDMLFDSFIDTAGDRERIERRLIAPAQKFCWDAYDICLDVSKGSDRLELMYQNIAHRAFTFCKVHQRKADFRRLCENRLRKDLANATKYANQQHSIDLTNPETLSRHLDTRFMQLETAVELELWQEAFRSVEDVHGLVAGRKSAKPSMMANYYEKLTQIFKAEGGKQTAIFHAAAWARYFQYAERAGNTKETAPGCVLLSALAVPLGEVESKQRLIALLNLPKMPTRESLVKDAAAKHLGRVPAELQQLYQVIEVDFQPLKASKILTPIITSLGPEYQPYLPALREVVLSRLLQELSQVYDTVALSHVLNLVQPFDGTSWATDEASLEKFLMSACRRGELNASIDHVSQCISFTPPPPEANRLSNLAICLYNTVHYLNPAPVTTRVDAFAQAIAQAEEERKITAQRRQIVAKRRELMEEANLRREKEESTAKAERAKIAAVEASRIQRELTNQAERARLQKEIDATRREEAKKLAESLAATSGLKVDIDSIEDLDTSKLVALQVSQLAKEAKELSERLRIVGKRVDHMERAFRKEERPLLAADYERQKEEDIKTHEATTIAAREQAIAHQKASLDLKNRLVRMMPDYLVARSAVESKQEAEFNLAREAAVKKIEAEKVKFKAQVVARRKAEREEREKRRLAEEEEERAQLAEEERLAAEDAEREAAEAKAKAEIEERTKEAATRAAEAKAKRDAERAEAEEFARKQRAREEEVEKRRAERAGGGARPPAPSSGGAYRPPGTGSAGGAYRPPGAASSSPTPVTAPTPVRAAAPAAAATGGGGGWRERLAARQAEGNSSGTSSPAPDGVSTPPKTASPAPPQASGSPASGDAAPPRGDGVYKRGMGVRRGGPPGGGSTPPARGGATGGSRW